MVYFSVDKHVSKHIFVIIDMISFSTASSFFIAHDVGVDVECCGDVIMSYQGLYSSRADARHSYD